jgi:dipeptidyl aminopeptidase/acylaminoacyl peptidase
VLTLVLLGSLAPTAHAQRGSAPRWTVDDMLLQESAAQFAFSPDGQWLVWVRSAMDQDKEKRAANLWLTRVADGESWPLTRGADSHGSPRWSPNGTLIAFTSNRAPPDKSESDDAGSGSQLWVLRLQGGDPWPITSTVRGLRGFAWKGPASDTIVFAAQEASAQFERARTKRKDTSVAVEDTLDSPPVRLWRVAVASKSVRRLTANPDWIESFTLSPDGRTAMTRNAVSLSYEYDQRYPPQAWLVDLTTGTRRRILEDGRAYPSGIRWSPDGRGFYFTYEYSTHPRYLTASVTRLGYFDVAADTMAPVELAWDRELGTGYELTPDGFVALLADGVRFRPTRYVRRGARWDSRPLEGPHVGQVSGITISTDGGAVAYVASTANTPPQPYVARLDGHRLRDERRIAKLNAALAEKPAPKVEIVSWTGALGERVEGVLYYPLNYVEGRRYPLILSIHGGPTGVDLDAWSMGWSRPLVLLNQLGAFVLKPNYHGSTNYGLAWVESIGNGKYYQLEIPDIEAGVDYLIARGLVHADSVATEGWSNGAILSTELTTRNPERYQASVAGAGDVEWISDWGNVDFGASFDNYYFGASPLEDPQRYIELSPFFRLDRVRAPTLLFFGTEDRNVPPSQGWSHYRAMQQIGTTPVRFVLFPGEPHGIGKLAHQRRKLEEELRWFERYLWGRPDTANLALDPASPLAGLIALEAAARDGAFYGRRVNGALVPETVRRGGLEIGRFEVTRAQWREFDRAYEVPAGTENLPASDIAFEQAQAYARWLCDRTGEVYRLPTSAELTPLATGAGVNLDYWAGYRPNPDDIERLTAAIGRLGSAAALLKSVGAFRAGGADGVPPVYDTNGNVAEWAIATDGTGVLVGASADRPAEWEGGDRPRLNGLRVVREN